MFLRWICLFVSVHLLLSQNRRLCSSKTLIILESGKVVDVCPKAIPWFFDLFLPYGDPNQNNNALFHSCIYYTHINRLIIEHTLSCPFSASILEKESIRRINTIMRPLITPRITRHCRTMHGESPPSADVSRNPYLSDRPGTTGS